MVKSGNAYFLYDGVSRIKNGLLYLGAGGAGTTASFNHAYDGFGNLQSLTTNGVSRNTPTNATTNRLQNPSVYDTAGNLTGWNGALYSYDRFGSMWKMLNGTEDWIYFYTADDERIWAYKSAANSSRWTLRDLDGKVLREYQNAAGVWSVQRDHVYRGSQLLAAHTADAAPKNLVQFHLDHLGTTRAITDTTGARTSYHVYYPFGEEATSITQDTERMKFTGHERDLGNTTSAADDLDYMPARFYNPQLGRFLRVDPKNRYQPLRHSQTWNRNSYAAGNPLKYVDPDGRDLVLPGNSKALRKFLIRSLQRPTFRESAIQIANDRNFAVTVRDAQITSPGAVATQRRRGEQPAIKFGTTTRDIVIANGVAQTRGAEVRIDTNMVGREHPDRAGVVTTTHEIAGHATDMREGGSDAEIQATHDAVEELGYEVKNESPDISKKEARRLLKELFKPPSK